jgi:hypothetical protein
MISLVVARAAHLAGDCSSGAARQHRQPGSGSASTITAGWHTLVRVWDGQQVRQYVDGLRPNTTATLRRAAGNEALDEAYVPFFGAFGAAWDDAMVARWSANPLGKLWPEMHAAFVSSGDGGPPAAPRRPVVVIAAG